MIEALPDPWLALIGIGEDGLTGLAEASRQALAGAAIVFGSPRHLALAGIDPSRGRPWPQPFSVAPVLEARGHRVAVLASGDPFWHGAGGSLSQHLEPHEWIAYPAPSTVSWAAARLGWRLEDVVCLGLHAAPLETLVPHLTAGRQVIALLRHGPAAGDLARWLGGQGFGATRLWVMEALGGRCERIREVRAQDFALTDVTAPVAVAMVVAGRAGLPRAAGLADASFVHDGQITSRPVRAMTVSALAPRHGERLWDIGSGSGSVAVEWCLAGGEAVAIEQRGDRVCNITTNAAAFGLLSRLTVVEGRAPAALDGLPAPDAVFVGGGGDAELLQRLWQILPRGTRLVANAVTLETEALLLEAHARHGGELLRIAVAEVAMLGRFRSWSPSRPVVQWSVTT